MSPPLFKNRSVVPAQWVIKAIGEQTLRTVFPYSILARGLRKKKDFLRRSTRLHLSYVLENIAYLLDEALLQRGLTYTWEGGHER